MLTYFQTLLTQSSSRSSRTNLYNLDTGSLELPNLDNPKRVTGNLNIRLVKTEVKNLGSDVTLPTLKEPGKFCFK